MLASEGRFKLHSINEVSNACPEVDTGIASRLSLSKSALPDESTAAASKAWPEEFTTLNCSLRTNEPFLVKISWQFNAKLLKRAESDVHFICKDGQAVKKLVEKAVETQERENFKLKILAKCPKISNDIVAEFELTLSLKDYTNR